MWAELEMSQVQDKMKYELQEEPNSLFDIKEEIIDDIQDELCYGIIRDIVKPDIRTIDVEINKIKLKEKLIELKNKENIDVFLNEECKGRLNLPDKVEYSTMELNKDGATINVIDKSSVNIAFPTHQDGRGSCSISEQVLEKNEASKESINTATKETSTLKCHLCSIYCENKLILESHLQTHSKCIPFQCPRCPYSCKRKTFMDVHMWNHGQNNCQVCNVCGYMCTRKRCFEDHMRRHSGARPYKCSLCSYASVSYQGLYTHKKRHGTETVYHKCPICSHESFSKGASKLHIATHILDGRFVCPHCDFRTTGKDCLKKHITNKHVHVCHVCSARCHTIPDLVNHLRNHIEQRQCQSRPFVTKQEPLC